MESGVIADAQITASSVLEWTDHTGQENSWKPEKARLKKPGPPWAAFATDEYQWLQVDLNKEKKITGKREFSRRFIMLISFENLVTCKNFIENLVTANLII